jgi:hypothetical protein
MAKKRKSGGRRNDDQARRECLQELHARLEAALAEGDLTPEQRQDYRDSLHGVLSRMTTRAVQRIQANVRGYKFYRTHDELTAAFKAKYPEAGVSKVLKGAFDRDGVLHLDGGGVLYGRPAPLDEFYGHELAHAIDGPDHEFSSSHEWKQVWKDEIEQTDFLGHNAKTKAAEGWAEFGAMVFSGTVSLKDVKDIFPRCLKFWRKERLAWARNERPQALTL